MTHAVGSATSRFPRRPEDLTDDFVAALLGRGVSRIAKTVIGQDRGMNGDLIRLDVWDDVGRLGTSLVAKFASQREGSLASARRSGAHEREVRFFQQVAPRTGVAVPYPLASWYDPDTCEFLLVQEFVDSDPAIDQLAGISPSLARLVIREMARLHATWWSSPDLIDFAWLPSLDGEARRSNLATITTTGWDPLCRLVGNEFTAEEQALGERLPKRMDDVLVMVGALTPTVIHSDLRTDNLLFAPDHSSVTLIDWQGVGRGPGAWDLAYFISQSLDVDVRRQCEAELIDLYVEALGDDGIHEPRDAVLAGYSESLLFGLAVASALPLISNTAEPRVRALAVSMSRRAIEALRDHGQLW